MPDRRIGVGEQHMVVKRSIMLDGKRTSISLEDPFFDGLKEIAADRSLTLSELVNEIRANRTTLNLSSSLRIFVLEHYRAGAKSALIGRRH